MKKIDMAGFSLLELMVVVVVVGLLASVAYPAYTDAILKGRRAQARVTIAELMQQQERFMTQRNCYLAFNTADDASATADASAECGITAVFSVPFKSFSGDRPSDAAYLLSSRACVDGSVAVSLRECVRIEARPVRPDPDAGVLWMSSTGARGCTGSASVSRPTLCWP
ncbi:MAG: type IV pilin protein [Polaromonas sp.]|nr:type IV pilin protein [Polaromonas sp.]